MPDPKLEEFTRANVLQPHFLHQLQRYVREIVQARLDEREVLLVRVAELEQELARAQERERAGRDPVEHSDGSPRGETRQTGRRHRVQQGGQEQAKETVSV